MNVDLLQAIINKKGWIVSKLSDDPSSLLATKYALFVGLDAKKRESIIELTERSTFASVTPPAPFSLPLPKSQLPPTIEFCFHFPFLVEEKALGQIAHLLHFINQVSPFPGFGLYELKNSLFFRYVWIASPSNQETQISTILDLITLNLSLFSDPIELIATGSLSFNEWLQEITPKI